MLELLLGSVATARRCFSHPKCPSSPLNSSGQPLLIRAVPSVALPVEQNVEKPRRSRWSPNCELITSKFRTKCSKMCVHGLEKSRRRDRYKKKRKNGKVKVKVREPEEEPCRIYFTVEPAA
ncbi:hypothetical protein RvY_16193 [Ramazzottius varieornatus]|uniref:Uncharacterized protein n=1 Tax=Ramazzottius varieornatus TaxID=947166 RepID=A0A1D1VYZ2_RAMVA|nr:hypothetical protein RvY_16193 [Ramazzottius varieornatus]